MRLVATFAACLLGACAPMQWIKPDTGADQAARDERECRESATREASARAYLPPLGPVFARDSMGRGSFIWPSGAMTDPYGQQLLEESRLAHFCMESRGYRLERATTN